LLAQQLDLALTADVGGHQAKMEQTWNACNDSWGGWPSETDAEAPDR
jgi:hypothetical protein